MIISIILLVLSIAMYLMAPEAMDKQFMSYNIAMAVLMFIAIYKKGKSSAYDLSCIKLRHSVVFAACFFIVFFQAALDYVVGFADDYSYFIYDSKVVCKGLALSNMAFASILIGYDVHKRKEYNLMPDISLRLVNERINKRYLMILASAMLVIYLIFIPKEFLNNGYGADISAGPVTMITGYLTAVFIAIFVLYINDSLIASEDVWYKKIKWVLLLCILYIIIIVITGRRTEAIRVGFMILFSYIYCMGRNVNYLRLAIVGLGAVLLFSIVGIVRSMESGNIVESYKTLSSMQSVLPFTQELSTSVNTLHIALSHYPDIFPFNHGLSFFPGFLKIIPGLSSLSVSIFGSDILNGSDILFTHIFFGNSNIEYGVGSSIVADVYISFGPIGVVVVFSLLGYFFRYLEIGTFCKKNSLYFAALSMSVYTQLMFACRSTIAIFFLCWTYACILIYITKKVAK